VDGWLLATILQPVPWGEGSRQYPPSGADLVIATLHLRGLCGVVWWSRDPIAPRRTALWETQWGQLNGHLVAGCVRAVGSSWPGLTSCVLPNSCNTPPLRGLPWRQSPRGRAWVQDSYLVDSASSHMLVSKIKPCMSKYKQLYRETANGSLNQLSFI
jgi:hypothetical protein